MLMTVLYCLGNASYEPGSTYDAHARSAALHAPSWHDASSGHGTWPDAPWCHASWPNDARTDAWTNAPAGSVSPHLLAEYFSNKIILYCCRWPQLSVLLTGCRKSSKSHPLPHQPARGDERAHAVHALQPVSNRSSSCVHVCLCLFVER